MLEKITFCIPSKNNLRYLKGSIRSIRNNCELKHDIIVYVDSDTDGTRDWLNANDVTFIENTTSEPTGIANAYNVCIREAKTNVVCAFHADMFAGKSFDVNLMKHLSPKRMVAATRIEPPLHPDGKEKIIKPFGMYPEDFNEEAFSSYASDLLIKNKDVTTSGIFAPWICYRDDILEIGGMDAELRSYYEDSDIFQRMILNGCSVIQSWDALVYHFTCRGGQFQDGVEKRTQDPKFHAMQNRSARYYIRKWGTWIRNDEYQHPVIPKKYNIGFVLRDITTEDFLSFVEPWATNIFVDNMICAERYITREQPNTNIDLKTKIYNHGYIDQINNDVLVYFSEKEFVSNPKWHPQIITNLSEMLSDPDIENNAEFEYAIFKLKTKQVKDISKQLIKI